VRKKTFLLMTLFFVLIFILYPRLYILAEQADIKVYIDGTIVNTEIEPALINGRIFLPARDIVEMLGGRITWFPALKLLNINIGNREVSVVINIQEAEVDGKKISLETAPDIIKNRVMIPIEVIHLLGDIQVDWNSSSRELKIIRNRPFITSIRSFAHSDKTRIVLDISEKTPFNVLTLSNPDRLVIDLDGSISQLDSDYKEINVNDPLVKKIRTGQFNKNTVRVVLDLQDNYEYNVFDLANPPRIVADILKPPGQIAELNQDSGQNSEPAEQSVNVGDEEKDDYVVVIDPGHGGKDPGAIGSGGLKEKEVVLDIALKLRKLLQNIGYTAYLTRDKDIDLPLENRPLMALQKEACVFISIHVNSVLQKGSRTAKGVETYVLNSRYIGASARDVADRENKASQYHNYEDNILNQIIADLEESASISFSLEFADIIQDNLVKYTNFYNRGVKQAPFIVLKGVNMAAVLVEVGFISNPDEEKLLKMPEFREKIAQSLAQSIDEYIKNIPEGL